MAHPVTDGSNLGHLVHYHRKRAELTRADLSRLAGVGATVIYELEHGKDTVQLNIVLRVLRALNLQLQIDGPLIEEYRSRETS